MESELTSSESEDDDTEGDSESSISMANRNYNGAGEVLGVERDEIKLANHPSLLNDRVHLALQEILTEVNLSFELADFQKLSLHVLGSGENLVLLSPTGSGKMIIVWLASLLMRAIYANPLGVTIGTQPLSLIMRDKLKQFLPFQMHFLPFYLFQKYPPFLPKISSIFYQKYPPFLQKIFSIFTKLAIFTLSNPISSIFYHCIFPFLNIPHLLLGHALYLKPVKIAEDF